MEKPNLTKMWRTWVKVGLKNQLTYKMLQDTVRYKMHNISLLQKAGKITWYYFLYHDKPDDAANGYFDIVFTTDRVDPCGFLPEYCVDTKKIPPMMEISEIDKTILQEEDIAEAWRIIGEQSEFIISLICAHAENRVVHPQQIAQFMHYFMNPLGLGLRSLMFLPEIPPAIRSQIRLMSSEVQQTYFITCF